MKKTLRFTILTLFCLGFGSLYAQVTTYDYTGSSDTYTVPIGVTSISIECYGAEGNVGLGAGGGDAGLGGYAEGELAVTPGDILNIFVGGQDGFNGGGTGGDITPTGWHVPGDFLDVVQGRATVRFRTSDYGGVVLFHCHTLQINSFFSCAVINIFF